MTAVVEYPPTLDQARDTLADILLETMTVGTSYGVSGRLFTDPLVPARWHLVVYTDDVNTSLIPKEHWGFDVVICPIPRLCSM